MRVSIRSPWRSTESSDRAPSVPGEFPTPPEVLTEIGLLLAVHLGLAVAVVLALRLFGIS